MSLHDLSTDVVPIAQLVVMALGLISLVLVWWQIRQVRLWNKLHTEQNYFNTKSDAVLEKELIEALKGIGIIARKTFVPLTPAQVETVLDDDRAYYAVKSYLNGMENLGAAVCIGAADSDLAYAVHSTRVKRAYTIFAPFIWQMRERYNDDEIYIELEKMALNWEAKRKRVKPEQERKIQELKKEVTDLQGAQPKV